MRSEAMVTLAIVGAVLSPSAGYTAWNGPVSEEYKPLTCPLGVLPSRIFCSGGYCDNMWLDCTSGAFSVRQRTWLDYFSEEGAHTGNCGAGFVTGMACKGSYCDNISLECSSLNGYVPSGNCYQTGQVSEENGGTLAFPPGYYPVRARCFGRYCDNMDFYVCTLAPSAAPFRPNAR
ncbi:hypothetical protein [Benzoatithermus flavus]|uniref:Uncharacterized protein n=1 Tax=Benzoatithermus flavus TaxID=3108223 RepID=A0ABU8XSZ1_9PROT